MKNLKMISKIKFNNIIPEDTFVSPGGYVMEMKGEDINFDFTESCVTILDEDKSVLEIECFNLEESLNTNITKKMISKITKIKEYYLDLIMKDHPCFPKEILSIELLMLNKEGNWEYVCNVKKKILEKTEISYSIEVTPSKTSAIKNNVEYELNRGWIYDENGEDPIGETNFIVSGKTLEECFKEKFSKEYNTLEEFLDVYEPETEGQTIYEYAKMRNAIKDDLGKVLY